MCDEYATQTDMDPRYARNVFKDHLGGLVGSALRPANVTAAQLLRSHAAQYEAQAEKMRYQIRELIAEGEAAQARAAEYREAANKLDGGEAKRGGEPLPSLDELRSRMAVGDVEGPAVREAEWLPPGMGASDGAKYDPGDVRYRPRGFA